MKHETLDEYLARGGEIKKLSRGESKYLDNLKVKERQRMSVSEKAEIKSFVRRRKIDRH